MQFTTEEHDQIKFGIQGLQWYCMLSYYYDYTHIILSVILEDFPVSANSSTAGLPSVKSKYTSISSLSLLHRDP